MGSAGDAASLAGAIGGSDGEAASGAGATRLRRHQHPGLSSFWTAIHTYEQLSPGTANAMRHRRVLQI